LSRRNTLVIASLVTAGLAIIAIAAAPVVPFSRTVDVPDQSVPYYGFSVPANVPDFKRTQESSLGSILYWLAGVGVGPSFRSEYSYQSAEPSGIGPSGRTITVIYRSLPTPDLAATFSGQAPLVEVRSMKLILNQSALGGITLSLTLRNLSDKQLTLSMSLNGTSFLSSMGSLLEGGATETFSMTVWPANASPKPSQRYGVQIFALPTDGSSLFTDYWALCTLEE
jgi:hypothetical protein